MKVSAIKQKITTENLRPTIPPLTPAAISQLIRDCWNGNPNDRPDFNQICEYLESTLTKLHPSHEQKKAIQNREGSTFQKTRKLDFHFP